MIYFLSQTLGELMFFFASDRRCFHGRNMIKKLVGRAEDGASPHTVVVFFPSYQLPKTVTVTMLLLFVHVTLLCGKFLCNKLI